MRRGAKCREVNSLVAFTDFGPVSPSRSTRSQEEQNAICPPGLKEIPVKNQTELLVYCRPRTALQTALERGCDIPGVAKDGSAPASKQALPGCSLQEPIPHAERDVQGHGLDSSLLWVLPVQHLKLEV